MKLIQTIVLSFAISFAARAQLNDSSLSILVNQVGYELKGPKTALIQSKTSSFAADSFYLYSSYGIPVYGGKVVPVGEVDGWKTGKYWLLNFSDFEKTGSYTIRLKEGNASSQRFTIGENILFDSTASKVVGFFRGMRDSSESKKSIPLHGGKGKTVNVYGGWSDATGDKGNHMSHLSYANYFNPQQSSMVVWSLLQSYSLNPKFFNSFSKELKEEAAWGADYLVRNVDPAGFLYLSVFIDFEDASKPVEVCEWGQPGSITQRTNNYQAALREGAGMAIASLAKAYQFKLKGEFSSDQYLNAAKKLYAHLKSPGKGYKTKNLEYCNNHQENCIDFYTGLLAAVELYKATSDKSYLKDARAFAESLMKLQQKEGWLVSGPGSKRPFYHAADEGMPVLALAEFVKTDTLYKGKVQPFMRSWVNWYTTITKEVNNPFLYVREYTSPFVKDSLLAPRTSFFLPHANETGYWWQGENARLASMTAAFMVADKFIQSPEKSKENRELAISQLDWILGKNPFNVCMMTGVGEVNYPTYLNGAKLPNGTGGVCNGISAGEADEKDIAWMPYNQSGGEHWKNWRWIEQWLPHDSWFLLAVTYVGS